MRFGQLSGFDGYCGFHGGFMGAGMMVLGLIIVALIVFAFYKLISNQKHGAVKSVEEDNSLKILRERFAKGEISEEEFEKAKKALE